MNKSMLCAASRAALIAAGVAALQLVTPYAGAQGQDFPNKPIKLVITFSPGGTADILSRQLAATMSASMGQPIVVESRPGAAGNIASSYVVKSPKDGYTLLFGTMASHALNVSIYKNMPYDVLRDLEPISLVARFGVALVINPKLPVHTVRELVSYGKSKPGGLRYASAGSGSSQHLGAEWFKAIAGVEMLHVPYKGDAPGLVDVMAGEVDLQFPILTAALALVKAGKLRALAVGSPKRSPLLPEVPTFVESGYPEFVYTSWVCLFGPAGLPKDVLQILNREAVKALNNPELQSRIISSGAEPISSTPEDLRAFIKAEIDKWAPIVKRAGATAD